MTKPPWTAQPWVWLVVFSIVGLATGAPGLGQTGAGLAAPRPTSVTERRASWLLHEQMRKSSPFRRMEWKAIGPRKQGGRIEAVAVEPSRKGTFYVGAGSGNLWKTTNHGVSWTPIFERESTFAIGDLAIAPSDPNVLWLGTGEVLMARSSYAGTGMFRSNDGGASWRNVGLEDSHHIAKVVVHPTDPDTVWVAALGHLYSFNRERGVFLTENGGATWTRVLFVDESTGAVDLVVDPSNLEILYAATWQRSRRAWGHVASGPGSGIHKSIDGGRTWRRLGGGFPSGENVGRIGLAVAPSAPRVVYALLDDRTPADPQEERPPPSGRVFRSEDGGESWEERAEQRVPAGYDFCLIRVAPDDADTVYVPGQVFWISRDGGRKFTEQDGEVVHLLPHPSTTLHLDTHELWIDPRNPDHWIVGNDGGVYVTWDSAEHWLHVNNLPVGEFYAVDFDHQEPFHVYGGTQDTAALWGPSNASVGAADADPWEFVYLDRWGGGDSYFTPVHPIDQHIVFYEHQFGDARRKDMRDGTTVSIRPEADAVLWPATEEKDSASTAAEPRIELRRNWMTPLLLSHYDPDTLYYGAQVVLRSRDRGDHWEVISPDLTSDPGPERRGNVPYGTLTSLSESQVHSGTLWTGSDDGRVHVTVDGGKSWSDRTGDFEGLWVSRVLASQHSKERAYVTLTGYREDDFRALVFTSEDLGKTWRSIASALPAESVNVIREDPLAPDLLYLGTDLGVYVSLDRGVSWSSLVGESPMGSLPTTPVHDLAIHPRDRQLVAGTHGRSVFVLDIAPIQELSTTVQEAPLHVFDPAPATRRAGLSAPPYRAGASAGEALIVFSFSGSISSGSSSAGPSIDIETEIEISSHDGRVVWSHRENAIAGLNFVRWDLVADETERPSGSFAPPIETVEAGTYRVVVSSGAHRAEKVLTVRDP